MGKTIEMKDDSGVTKTVNSVLYELQDYTDVQQIEMLEIVANIIAVRHEVKHNPKNIRKTFEKFVNDQRED